MLELPKVPPLKALAALVAAVTIAGAGTGLGLAAASINGGRGDDGRIQLVRPSFHISPEQDRANHDLSNHG